MIFAISPQQSVVRRLRDSETGDYFIYSPDSPLPTPHSLLNKHRGLPLIERYLMSQGEDRHSVEGLIAQDTGEVAESQIKLIKVEQMPEKAPFFKG